MSNNDWKKKLGVVYSTNQDYQFEKEEEEVIKSIEPNKQTLYVSLDKKQRKGKLVTIVSNYIGSTEELNSLAKDLKVKCGSGGSVKDNEIIIQGNKRDFIIKYLQEKQFKVKQKGG